MFFSWAYGAKSSSDNENWVKVEKSPVIIEEKDGKKQTKFLSFKDRRASWGFRIGLSGETWETSSYPASSTESFNLSTDSIDFGLQLMASYNLPVFSVGAGVNLSSLNLEGNVSGIKMGMDVHAYLDGFMENPYLVPSVKLGVARISFQNPSGSDVETNNTKLAMYYSVGIMFLLDWFQKTLAMDAYFDYGIQGSFFYLEYEMFPSLQSEKSALPGEFDLSGIKFGLQIVL